MCVFVYLYSEKKQTDLSSALLLVALNIRVVKNYKKLTYKRLRMGDFEEQPDINTTCI